MRWFLALVITKIKRLEFDVMFMFQVTLSGISYNIISKYPVVRDYYREFLTNGRKPAIPISIDEDDLIFEWHKHPEFGGNDYSSRKIWYEPLLEKYAISRKIIEQFPTYSSILMHGAVFCDGINSYLFTAPSATGKTTRVKMLLQKHPEGFILNGDKPLIRVEKDRVVACGTPWKGKENLGINIEKTLKAIFLLERANSTVIKPISLPEAFGFLLHQTYFSFDGSNTVETIKLLKSLEGKVRLFRFLSPLTFEAVEAAYTAANE